MGTEYVLIPMKKQQTFSTSLDVYANVVCLCPVCHRLLHYGLDDNKKIYLIRCIWRVTTDLLIVE